VRYQSINFTLTTIFVTLLQIGVSEDKHNVFITVAFPYFQMILHINLREKKRLSLIVLSQIQDTVHYCSPC